MEKDPKSNQSNGAIAEDAFDPTLLVGKKILFQCEDRAVLPSIVEILSVHNHYKAVAVHKGRVDLVVYKTNVTDLYLMYEDIVNLIEKGESIGKRIKYELKIINMEWIDILKQKPNDSRLVEIMYNTGVRGNAVYIRAYGSKKKK